MTFSENPLFQEPEADRIAALKLPERAQIAWPSVRDADIDVLRKAPARYIDTTHFDTVRFPPPPWAEQRFLEAARDGSRAYSGYRGHEDILEEVAANVSRFLGVKLDPRKNLILTPGTQAALFATLSARVNKSERIAVFDPDYLFTARIVGFLGAADDWCVGRPRPTIRLADAGAGLVATRATILRLMQEQQRIARQLGDSEAHQVA